MKPNQEQVKAEIEKLKEMKPKIRRYTAFGEDNRAAIEAQIRVLERGWDFKEIYDRYDDNEHELDAAMDARDWLIGESDEKSLSENWQGLVQEA